MLRKNASRMRVISVYDLSARESLRALTNLRRQFLSLQNPNVPLDELPVESDEVMRQVYNMIGGRTSYLVRAARGDDILEEAKEMVQREKGWLLSQIGLIPEMDDDVM